MGKNFYLGQAGAYSAMLDGHTTTVFLLESEASGFEPAPGWVWHSNGHLRDGQRWAQYQMVDPKTAQLPLGQAGAVLPKLPRGASSKAMP
jgi:hypothetical protein